MTTEEAYWAGLASECDGCGYSDKCRCGEQIRAYLVEHGWKADGPTAYTLNGDLRCDLSGGDGYVWQLQEFTDGDIDGVATGRWRDMDYDGYDRLSLIQSLRRIELQASERLSDARAKWAADKANEGDWMDREED